MNFLKSFWNKLDSPSRSAQQPAPNGHKTKVSAEFQQSLQHTEVNDFSEEKLENFKDFFGKGITIQSLADGFSAGTASNVQNMLNNHSCNFKLLKI